MENKDELGMRVYLSFMGDHFTPFGKAGIPTGFGRTASNRSR